MTDATTPKERARALSLAAAVGKIARYVDASPPGTETVPVPIYLLSMIYRATMNVPSAPWEGDQ